MSNPEELTIDKFPPWVKEVSLAFKAYRNTRRIAQGKLGEIGRGGEIGQKLQDDIEAKFYPFLDLVKDKLPGTILLSRSFQSPGVGFQINEGKVRLKIVGNFQPARYFTTKNYGVHRYSILPDYTPETVDPQYLPGSPEFIGMDEICRFCLWSVNRKRSQEQVDVYHEGTLSKYGGSYLSIKDINKIVEIADQELSSAVNHQLVEKVRGDISDITTESQAQRQAELDRAGYQLRTRAIQLSDRLKESSGQSKFPSMIKVGADCYDRQADHYVKKLTDYFLKTEEGMLIEAPVEPTFLSKFTFLKRFPFIAQERANLSKAREASIEQWFYQSAGYKLLELLPVEVRKVVINS